MHKGEIVIPIQEVDIYSDNGNQGVSQLDLLQSPQ